jgi:hypothetical protein
MTSKQKTVVGRREFLRVAGVGAAAAVATPLATEASADTEKNDENRKARYQESAHVKKYYQVNRYPAK